MHMQAARAARSTSLNRRPIRIVALGGGTGLPAVLRALRLVIGATAPASSLTAIVAVTDDGGSSGELRRRFGVLPPGDVRNCVAALAGEGSRVGSLLQHRFGGGTGLEGHPVGNLILTALTQQLNGDFAAAVQEFSRLVGIGGRVLPATTDNVHLRAEYVSGEVTVGVSAIVSRRLPIRRLSLERPVRPLPEVIEALVNADVIIVGPGSLYTSILPILLVGGIAATISGVMATRVFIANLMTEPGETDGFSLGDHLAVIKCHTGFDLFDHVLLNRRPLDPAAVAQFRARGSEPVQDHRASEKLAPARAIECDLSAEHSGGKIRHEPVSLAAALQQVLASPMNIPSDRAEIA